MSKPNKAELHRLYWDEHKSLKALGEQFGVDGATIRNWMIAYDIPRRDLSPGKPRSKQHRQAISKAQKRLVTSGKRRYDGEHSPAWKGGPITVECGWCGKPVEIPRAYAKQVKHTFCKDSDCLEKWQSQEFSRRQYYKPHYGSKDATCDYCGKTIRRQQHSLRGKNLTFCNRECQQLYSNDEFACENCGKMFLRPKYRDRGQARSFCSPSCKKEFMRGDKVYNFKGGYEPYYGPSWRTQRRKARKRDSYICQECGIHQSELGRALDIHHIIPFSEFGVEQHRKANHLDNLISLCGSCHSKKTANGFATPHHNCN